MASNEKLQQTWFNFLTSTTLDNYEQECKHIYGYDKADDTEFEISKLQKITAQRILDYEDLEKVCCILFSYKTNVK